MADLISIIVPVYNEAATIAAVVERLLSIDLPAAREIIVVDDGSRDGTAAALAQFASRESVTVITQPANRGKGAAVRTGLARSRGSVVAIQDADLELDPEQLADLVQPVLREGVAAVYGSRFLSPSGRVPLATSLGNRTLTAITNLLYRQSLTDMETCYKVMRGDIARGLPLTADRFDIEPEITARLILAGVQIVERPVTFNPRSKAAGKKIRWRDGIDAVSMLWRLRYSGGTGASATASVSRR